MVRSVPPGRLWSVTVLGNSFQVQEKKGEKYASKNLKKEYFFKLSSHMTFCCFVFVFLFGSSFGCSSFDPC